MRGRLFVVAAIFAAVPVVLEAPGPSPVAAKAAGICTTPNVYPGDDAGKAAIAVWMARAARDRGIPGELPVMGALVESDIRNLPDDGATAGYFQIRTQIWNQGEYAGFPQNPNLQIEWFIDQAVEMRARRIAAGDAAFGTDPAFWGEWVADVVRPAEQFRGRYQLELDNARALIGELCTNPAPADITPPETSFTRTPKNRVSSKLARYGFTASEPGSTFLCRFDKRRPRPCASPHRLKRLKPGTHRFAATALDPAGNADATPATDRFKVEP